MDRQEDGIAARRCDTVGVGGDGEGRRGDVGGAGGGFRGGGGDTARGRGAGTSRAGLRAGFGVGREGLGGVGGDGVDNARDGPQGRHGGSRGAGDAGQDLPAGRWGGRGARVGGFRGRGGRGFGFGGNRGGGGTGARFGGNRGGGAAGARFGGNGGAGGRGGFARPHFGAHGGRGRAGRGYGWGAGRGGAAARGAAVDTQGPYPSPLDDSAFGEQWRTIASRGAGAGEAISALASALSARAQSVDRLLAARHLCQLGFEASMRGEAAKFPHHPPLKAWPLGTRPEAYMEALFQHCDPSAESSGRGSRATRLGALQIVLWLSRLPHAEDTEGLDRGARDALAEMANAAVSVGAIERLRGTIDPHPSDSGGFAISCISLVLLAWCGCHDRRLAADLVSERVDDATSVVALSLPETGSGPRVHVAVRFAAAGCLATVCAAHRLSLIDGARATSGGLPRTLIALISHIQTHWDSSVRRPLVLDSFFPSCIGADDILALCFTTEAIEWTVGSLLNSCRSTAIEDVYSFPNHYLVKCWSAATLFDAAVSDGASALQSIAAADLDGRELAATVDKATRLLNTFPLAAAEIMLETRCLCEVAHRLDDRTCSAGVRGQYLRLVQEAVRCRRICAVGAGRGVSHSDGVVLQYHPCAESTTEQRVLLNRLIPDLIVTVHNVVEWTTSAQLGDEIARAAATMLTIVSDRYLRTDEAMRLLPRLAMGLISESKPSTLTVWSLCFAWMLSLDRERTAGALLSANAAPMLRSVVKRAQELLHRTTEDSDAKRKEAAELRGAPAAAAVCLAAIMRVGGLPLEDVDNTGVIERLCCSLTSASWEDGSSGGFRGETNALEPPITIVEAPSPHAEPGFSVPVKRPQLPSAVVACSMIDMYFVEPTRTVECIFNDHSCLEAVLGGALDHTGSPGYSSIPIIDACNDQLKRRLSPLVTLVHDDAVDSREYLPLLKLWLQCQPINAVQVMVDQGVIASASDALCMYQANSTRCLTALAVLTPLVCIKTPKGLQSISAGRAKAVVERELLRSRAAVYIVRSAYNSDAAVRVATAELLCRAMVAFPVRSKVFDSAFLREGAAECLIHLIEKGPAEAAYTAMVCLDGVCESPERVLSRRSPDSARSSSLPLTSRCCLSFPTLLFSSAGATSSFLSTVEAVLVGDESVSQDVAESVRRLFYTMWIRTPKLTASAVVSLDLATKLVAALSRDPVPETLHWQAGQSTHLLEIVAAIASTRSAAAAAQLESAGFLSVAADVFQKGARDLEPGEDGSRLFATRAASAAYLTIITDLVCTSVSRDHEAEKNRIIRLADFVTGAACEEMIRTSLEDVAVQWVGALLACLVRAPAEIAALLSEASTFRHYESSSVFREAAGKLEEVFVRLVRLLHAAQSQGEDSTAHMPVDDDIARKFLEDIQAPGSFLWIHSVLVRFRTGAHCIPPTPAAQAATVMQLTSFANGMALTKTLSSFLMSVGINYGLDAVSVTNLREWATRASARQLAVLDHAAGTDEYPACTLSRRALAPLCLRVLLAIWAAGRGKPARPALRCQKAGGVAAVWTQIPRSAMAAVQLQLSGALFDGVVATHP